MAKIRAFFNRNQALMALVGEALIFAAVLTGCYFKFLQWSILNSPVTAIDNYTIAIYAVFIILITQMSLHCLPGWIRQKQQGHKQNDQSDLLLLHKYFSSSPAAHSAGAVFCFLCLLIR